MNSPEVISKSATERSPKSTSKTSPKRGAKRDGTVGVLVLGMHRSGTSALTRVLNLLGCALPEALVGPSEGNEMGHWEAASAVVLNDEILESAGSSWNDWGPINADWQLSGVRTQMLERATDVVREHKSLGPLFALKDPRLCRLADLWLEAGDAAGVEMRVVLMLRHPREVAASLESRDLMASGFGELLWLRHALDAEHYSRGRQRVVCRFDRLLLDWQGTIDRIRHGLSVALPRNSPKAHAEVEQFLTGDMRHHDVRTDAELGLQSASGWLKRSFDILYRWSEQGEDAADYDELDRIRAEFDNAYPSFSRLLLSADFSGEFAAGSRLRQELQEELAGASENVREIEQLRLRDTEMSGKLAALTAAYETIQDRASALQAEAERLRNDAVKPADLEAERSLRLEAERAIADREAELEQERARSSELAGQIATVESAARQRQEELAQLWDQLATLQRTAGASAAEAAMERDRRTETEARLAATLSDLRTITAQKSELEVRARVAETALASRQDDQQRLADRLAEASALAAKTANDAVRERDLRVERESELARAQSALADLKRQVEAIEQAPQAVPDATFEEIAQLTRMLQAMEAEAANGDAARAGAERHAEWLRDMAALTERLPKWWALMPDGWRRKRQHEAYRRAGLFDADQYLQNNPDVSAHGMDPVRHYMLHGMAEGRQIWR